MKESVVISKDQDGIIKVFPSMVKAAEDAGVTRQSIIQAIKEGRACAGRQWRQAFRIYVLKADGKFRVCRKMKDGYQELPGGCVIPARNVDMLRVVDVTGPMWAVNM